MYIFADQIGKVSLSNNTLRIELTQLAANDQTVEAGTLIIPVNQANNFVNGLAGSLKQLDEQLKAQREKQQDPEADVQ